MLPVRAGLGAGAGLEDEDAWRVEARLVDEMEAAEDEAAAAAAAAAVAAPEAVAVAAAEGTAGEPGSGTCAAPVAAAGRDGGGEVGGGGGAEAGNQAEGDDDDGGMLGWGAGVEVKNGFNSEGQLRGSDAAGGEGEAGSKRDDAAAAAAADDDEGDGDDGWVVAARGAEVPEVLARLVWDPAPVRGAASGAGGADPAPVRGAAGAASGAEGAAASGAEGSAASGAEGPAASGAEGAAASGADGADQHCDYHPLLWQLGLRRPPPRPHNLSQRIAAILDAEGEGATAAAAAAAEVPNANQHFQAGASPRCSPRHSPRRSQSYTLTSRVILSYDVASSLKLGLAPRCSCCWAARVCF